VAFLRELVESPALNSLLDYLSRPSTDMLVEGVAFVEDLGHLERVGEHYIALLARSVSASVSSHGFDMAFTVAGTRHLSALALRAADGGSVTSSTKEIANSFGTAILGIADGTSLAELALAIGRELGGESDVALLRAHTAVRAIAAHPHDGTVQSLLDSAGGALGLPLSMASTQPRQGLHRPVIVGDRVNGWVTTQAPHGDLASAAEIVLDVAARGVADALTRADRIREVPTQSREEVLADLLAATPKTRDQVVSRARSLGLPIDGWHVVVRLDFEDLADPPPGQELTVYESRARLGAAAIQGARAAGGTWHEARVGEAFVLVRSYQEDPGGQAAEQVASTMDEVLSAVGAKSSTTIIRCGVGSLAAGPKGLLASVAEAKAAALLGRTSKRANIAVAFDTVGLRRTLVEWYSSDTAREAATSVLQPLSDLGGVRAERLIQTLHVYLDERGSLTRTAQRLNLHRNAVAYRVRKIFELLDVDPDNADDLLLLQLACRARELE
jgi:sugar diacid utilization regulator